MADATTTLLTADPKQLGKQLRAVRRRKGLSLSEVARGAGLSRRELVNYERGKVEIPESDLWVLAGSCGVDVAELVPASEPLALGPAPSSIEDSITQLRSNQPDAGLSRHFDTLYALRALPAGSAVQLQERERAAMADALGHDPDAIEAKLVDRMRVSKDEARRLRSLIVPDAPRYSPLALEAPEPEPVPEPEPAVSAPVTPDPFDADPAAPEPFSAMSAGTIPGSSAFDADVPTGNVDVFEELAKLPEPIALPEQGDHTDFLSPKREPSFADVSDGPADGAFAAWPAFRSALPEPTGDPVLVDMQAGATAATTANGYGAEHAAPIDVVGRAGRFDVTNGSDNSGADTLPTPDAPSWEPPPPIWDATCTTTDTSAASGGPGGPTDIVEFIDEYVVEPVETSDTESADPESSPLWSTWNRADFVDEGQIDDAVDQTPEAHGEIAGEVVAQHLDETADLLAAPVADNSPWDHDPDPAATSSGFYVDWGTEETADERETLTTDATPDVWTTTETATPDVWTTADTAVTDVWTTEDETEASAPAGWATESEAARPEALEPEALEPEALEPEAFEPVAPMWEVTEVSDDDPPSDPDTSTWTEEPDRTDAPGVDDEPAPISWRPLADTVLAAVAVELAAVSQPATDATLDTSFETTVAAPELEPEPEPEPVEVAPVEDFVAAGPEWQLGNAVPLVEVRGQGGLVMRRADERWALADVTTTPNFALEVDVDFRSGPGFGVLFHASTDANGHMSGYSFDVDPIHEGGSFLVRQWQADRELWNPIARVAAPDPAAMHGLLALRVVVLGDRLAASVNGSTVLEIESLEEACAERNRQPARGDRVGIQAWSSSDLEIETLRVAPR